ncbi:bacterio-opsin activator domain-containing protein [Halocatena pleomorpha]|uniref:PAS domain S-box protein n=1 Tax=Halocatena pleomorpha TaxID=1785090 RepID=A0A3P3RAC4_9EURY|nr:bacterio-opsin activator domain-containing protein [Halocatena pleomorpha]RRJ30325.1 PAS domain S-box protein [Halocatena pleomorpha]
MASSTTTLPTTDVVVVGTAEWMDDLAETLTAVTDASVRRLRTVEATVEHPASAVDCVLTGYELADGTGIDLLQAVTTTTPILLCTASGNERIASDAMAAGAVDYIALSDPSSLPSEEIIDRLSGAVRDAWRTETRRERSRQFEAVFQNSQTATWVLDSTGQLQRANRTALAMIDPDVSSLTGEQFWDLPWWTERSPIERFIRSVIDDQATDRLVTTVGGDEQIIELSALPVQAPGDELAGIVIEGDDITERVSLYRELRSSEELHRVTLNNMTDTVLVTDDDGSFTYICPNVHFIFGYTASEIREFSTIDELLGDDLFDPDELSDAGVLKNIECTTTDKTGQEHTLLVNVRSVSIQDGTRLYSCRDITKRKQREEALATLQETTRDFLYAETPQEIANHIVDDVSSVLDVTASAVYQFDPDRNVLEPVAQSSPMERLHGPLPAVPADAATLPSYSFVEDDALFFADVHDSPRLENQATDVRSGAYIPLGDHGVFVAGSSAVGQFDAVTRELADLLAATAEAALDRIRRERRLREQERELQHRNTELTALNQINEIIRDIDQALVQAETREEIEHAVCRRLTAEDRFAFAWIGVEDAATDSIAPRAWAGTEQGYLDSLSFPIGVSDTEPAGRTGTTQTVTRITNVANRFRQESWRKEALSRNFLSILSVPIAYDDFTYGVLSVYAETQNAFDETAQAVLAELGETIASAVSAIERKNALLTTSITRVRFIVDDPLFVLSRIARTADCTLTYHGGVRQTTDGSYLFVAVEGAPMDAVERAARELVAVDDVQPISTDNTEGVLRIRLPEQFLALELADHGAVLRRASVDSKTTTLVIDIPETVDSRHITHLVTDAFENVELRSKRTIDQSAAQNVYSRFLDRVTDRQFEVLQTAYYSGFFESPREQTGEEIAKTLDISPPAFYQHIRTVQRKLFTTVFDDHGLASLPS